MRVYGEDMTIIRKKADEVQKVLAGVAGVVDARVQYPEEMPALEIEVYLDKAKHYGLKPAYVRWAATTQVSGFVVGNLFDEQSVFDVVAWGTDNTRRIVTSINE